MTRVPSSTLVDATKLALALTESFPEFTYGAVPASEYEAALEAYQDYEEGVFDEVPLALDAYLDHQNGLHA